MSHDLDPDLAVAVVKTLRLLSDGPAYERRLAELRGIGAAADAKVAAAAALDERARQAERMMADATALLTKQTAREQDIERREAVLGDREERLVEKIEAADEAHAAKEQELATKARLLAAQDDALHVARKALGDAMRLLRDEWGAVEQVHRELQTSPAEAA